MSDFNVRTNIYPFNVILLIMLLFISKARAEDAENHQRIKDYYVQAQTNYDNGDYGASRKFINEALSITPENGDYPGIFVLSGMLYMQNNDCESALNEIHTTLAKLDILAVLADKKKIDLHSSFGENGYSAFNENYYLATKIYAYCNYVLLKPEESKKGFLVIEKRWQDKFKLGEIVRLAHDYQLIGDDKNAIKYYTMSFKVANEALNDAASPTEKKVKAIIESARYNIAIAYGKQNDTRSANQYIKMLLSGSDEPNYWIDKMLSDKDYQLLIKKIEIKKTIDTYKK